MFDSDGPAHSVQGFFTTAMPSTRAKVSNAFEAGGFAWVAASDGLYRVGGDGLRRIAVANVDGIVRTGRTIWLTTHGRGFMAARGPTFRMEEQALVPERLDITGCVCIAAGRAWLRYAYGGRIAEAMQDGCASWISAVPHCSGL
jgi:hypothetical protein